MTEKVVTYPTSKTSRNIFKPFNIITFSITGSRPNRNALAILRGLQEMLQLLRSQTRVANNHKTFRHGVNTMLSPNVFKV